MSANAAENRSCCGRGIVCEQEGHRLDTIDLKVAGEEIAVNREPPQHSEHQDVAVAICDAFDATRRLLEEYLRRRRRQVKTHEPLPHGRVSRLFPAEGYGFLQTPDGRETYFHRHSVLPHAFQRLAVGTEVTFVEEEGSKEPQARNVRMAGRPHRA